MSAENDNAVSKTTTGFDMTLQLAAVLVAAALVAAAILIAAFVRKKRRASDN
jgi:hypothetical protein